MKDEGQEAVEARRAGGDDYQGRMRQCGGRSTTFERPPPTLLRLKPSIDLHHGSDGRLYLLRLGSGDDQVVENPRPMDRRLLQCLAEGFSTEAQLLDELADMGCGSAELSVLLDQLQELGVLELRTEPRPLSELDQVRFDRQLNYLADLAAPGVGADELQQQLLDARVAVIGCGGLGCWAATGLSLSGVGALHLVDDDVVELHNLNRQLLFDEGQIGELKVDAAMRSLLRQRPDLEVTCSRRRIDGETGVGQILELEPDLVICTGDWPPHELPRWINRACVRAGVPWIGAGQFPPRLRVGPLVIPRRTPCLECLENRARAHAPLYDEIAAGRLKRRLPDPSTGPVSAVIGSLLASEAMHFLIGVEPASAGSVLLLDLRTMILEKEAVAPTPGCGCQGGEIWERVALVG